MYNILTQCTRVMPDSLQPHGLYSPWNSPGQNTEVSSLSLLHRIFPTQGLNTGLLHCRQILYQLSHQGSPRVQQGTPESLPRKAHRHWFQILIIYVSLVGTGDLSYSIKWHLFSDMILQIWLLQHNQFFQLYPCVKGHIFLFSLCK